MKIVRRILLALIFVGAAAAGVLFMGKYEALDKDCTEKVSAAEAEWQAEQTKLQATDRTAGEGAAAWEEWKSGVLADKEAALAAIEEENKRLDASISDAEARLKENLKDEDTAYYMAIYDSLQEGMSKVEEYIG